MNQVSCDNSSPPNLMPHLATSEEQPHVDLVLEGVAANIKLLLKLVQDQKYACSNKERNDSKRSLRVATMVTILDTVRSRIQGCQSLGNRSKDDARPYPCHHIQATTDQDPSVDDDEKERLRRELKASLAAQKSLQVMCTSLGKEKEIMAAELSKKAGELSGMEELVDELKVQNEALMRKVQDHCYADCAPSSSADELKERNKALSEKLWRSLEGYRRMKRKLKGVEEENAAMHAAMDEVCVNVGEGLEGVGRLKGHNGEVGEEMVALESMLECLRRKMTAARNGQHGDAREEQCMHAACSQP